MWICHAERPLQVDELRQALAVEIGAKDLDSENAPSIGALLGACQGLVTVDKEASTVRLIHFTVQEYLFAQPGLFSQPHSVIAETCLTYLNSPQVKNLSSNSSPDYQIMPFLKYSSRYWGTHANREASDHARVLRLQLLSHYKGHPSAVSLLEQALPTGYTTGTDSPPRFSGIHFASFFGMVELVASLITAQCCGINQRDCAGYTPLSWATYNGHEGVVKLLLSRNDVDPDRPDDQSSTPLLWAALNVREEVAKLLLGRNDANPDRPDNQDSTPLSWAALNGHEGVVKLLLSRDEVDPDRPDDQDRTLLSWAAQNGHKAVVKLLLSRNDVNPDRPGNQGGTPLAWAANNGHEGVVKLLLRRKDVDPNHPEKRGRTPLLCAAFYGHEGVVKLLLSRKDVDPNRLDNNGQTPVGCAASASHVGVVKLLLGREDVDPDHQGGSDQTPLRPAALKGKPTNWASGSWAGLGRNRVGSGRVWKPGVWALPPKKKARKILSLLFRKSQDATHIS